MQWSPVDQIRDRGLPIRILHLEDNALDFELIQELLRDVGLCETTNVRTQGSFEEQLLQNTWDLILADFALPSFDGLSAPETARRLKPATPFIFVTGTMGEHNAVESLKHGATDYVLKQHLVRLGPAVVRALKERTETLLRLQAEQKLQEREAQLQFLAYHDGLTGLPNRVLFLELLSERVAGARRRKEKTGVLFVDLDHFKLINDSLGHAAGDTVLKSVAQRLRNVARADDVVARLGGDEFTILLTKIKDSSDGAMVAERINKAIAEEISLGDRTVITTCSVGISIFPEDGNSAEVLIKNADAALYASKGSGRNAWRFFTNDLNRKALERLTLETAMHRALADGQLSLVYQPQIDISTGQVVGAEALLRWRHPELGLVSPSTFIPVAESTGEIIAIGEWVLRTACSQARQWQSILALRMSVNASAVQFRDPAFLDKVEKTLRDTGLNAQFLELELTENQLIENQEVIVGLMHSLRAMGLRVAIDDFGTGYCGFSYLRNFPFSRLKLDESFVHSILTKDRDVAITEAVIRMAKVLDARVTAECVETFEQLKLLEVLGCDEVQGFYYSPPLDAHEFEKFLLDRTKGSANSGRNAHGNNHQEPPSAMPCGKTLSCPENPGTFDVATRFPESLTSSPWVVAAKTIP